MTPCQRSVDRKNIVGQFALRKVCFTLMSEVLLNITCLLMIIILEKYKCKSLRTSLCFVDAR